MAGNDVRFSRKSVLHDVAPRCVFWPKSHARTMFSPSFHVHEQGYVYMSKGGCRCTFCPKVRFTRCCPALRFMAKITCAHHVFAQFSCKRARLAVHEQGRVPMPVLPESPFYTMLPRAAFFGQNHMRAPCFRPVFMYMSKVSCT